MSKKIISNLSVVLSLLIFSIFILLLHNLGLFMGRIEQNLTISAFLTEGFSDEAKINNLITEIKKSPEVKDVVYISKDKAMNEFLLRTPELSEQIKASEHNPLPASLEVKLTNPIQLEQVKNLATRLSGLEGIESAEYPELEINKLAEFRRAFNGITLILGIILLASTTLVIIQLNWLNFKLKGKEAIMEKFIKTSLKEGVLSGLFSGLLSLIILYVLFSILILKIPHLKFLPLGYLGGILIFSITVPTLVNLYFNKYGQRGD